ncbi:MAG: hypothetical protein BroJett003_22960 [Planctomycetota bacterium]|nr:MAG: hypothetical protein BroJett003_22960 [Planctomycetota bacterium]
MSKPLLGLMLGGILGALDGLSAMVTSADVPEVKEGLVGIIIGSTAKGLVAGICIGFFSRKFKSLALGVAFGVVIGFLLALPIALNMGHHYLEILLPGSMVGLIVGYATQRYGTGAARAPA